MSISPVASREWLAASGSNALEHLLFTVEFRPCAGFRRGLSIDHDSQVLSGFGARDGVRDDLEAVTDRGARRKIFDDGADHVACSANAIGGNLDARDAERALDRGGDARDRRNQIDMAD